MKNFPLKKLAICWVFHRLHILARCLSKNTAAHPNNTKNKRATINTNYQRRQNQTHRAKSQKVQTHISHNRNKKRIGFYLSVLCFVHIRQAIFLVIPLVLMFLTLPILICYLQIITIRYPLFELNLQLSI